MVTIGNENIVEQIKKQLHKLIDIVKVLDLTFTKYIERELALIKVQAKPEYRAEILRIVDIFRCKVIDVGHGHYTLEVTGDEEKLTAILNLLKPFGIKEVARTGSIALNRDTK
jgi:acetolactate synthase-1/3 small subunit